MPARQWLLLMMLKTTPNQTETAGYGGPQVQPELMRTNIPAEPLHGIAI